MKTEIVPFNSTTIRYLRDLILDYQISDEDSITLYESLFDELALDYREDYGESLKVPFIFLGVWIKIYAKDGIKYGQSALLTRNDPKPMLYDEFE